MAAWISSDCPGGARNSGPERGTCRMLVTDPSASSLTYEQSDTPTFFSFLAGCCRGCASEGGSWLSEPSGSRCSGRE